MYENICTKSPYTGNISLECRLDNWDVTEFNFSRYGDWPVAYHGTRPKYVSSIMEEGFRPSTNGCYRNEMKGNPRVYLSPSIEYSGHPLYAETLHRNNKWVQVVLQVRFYPSLLMLPLPGKLLPGTLQGAFSKNIEHADPNFPNEKLEWVFPAKLGNTLFKESLVVHGIMLRVTNEHPRKLACTKWWGQPPKDLRGWRLTPEQWQ